MNAICGRCGYSSFNDDGWSSVQLAVRPILTKLLCPTCSKSVQHFLTQPQLVLIDVAERNRLVAIADAADETDHAPLPDEGTY